MAILTFQKVVFGKDFYVVRTYAKRGDIWQTSIPEGGTPNIPFFLKGKVQFLDENFQPYPMGEIVPRARAPLPVGVLTIHVLESIEWYCLGHNDDLWIDGEFIELAIKDELIVLKGKHVFIVEGSVDFNRETKSANTMMHVTSGDIMLTGKEAALLIVFELAEV